MRIRVTLLSAILVGCFAISSRAQAYPVLLGTVVITHDLDHYTIVDIYDNMVATSGWAHVTENGDEFWVSFLETPGPDPSSNAPCQCDGQVEDPVNHSIFYCHVDSTCGTEVHNCAVYVGGKLCCNHVCP